MPPSNSLAARLALSLLIGLLLAWLLSEGAFLILSDGTERDPKQVDLLIPAGTAERIAAGQPPLSIPTEMLFVKGDTLVVKNEDTTPHQLGPVWVPPGTSASLALNEANDYTYSCSFQPSRSIGLTVRSRVTTTTRIQAILLAGPPMAALIALYSAIIWPLTSRKPDHPPLASPTLPPTTDG
jgi:hypothetical protein